MRNVAKRRHALETNMRAMIWTSQSPMDGATEHIFEPICFGRERVDEFRQLVGTLTKKVTAPLLNALKVRNSALGSLGVAYQEQLLVMSLGICKS